MNVRSTKDLNAIIEQLRDVGINVDGGGIVGSYGVLLVYNEHAQQAVAELQNRGFETRIY